MEPPPDGRVAMAEALTLRNVSKTFQDSDGTILDVLRSITLTIERGEFFIFVGASGSGKSTLLRMMSGLETPSGGTIVRASDIGAGDIAFVFQQFALLPWLTVEANIGLGLLSRVPDPERRKRVHRELAEFGLDDFAKYRPRDLSGGMRQRVGIARAFAVEPKVLFLDEPFSELDSFTASSLRHELLGLWERRRPTIIMVTHILEEAVELADRIAVLSERPGRVRTVIENTLPRPRQLRSPEFFAQIDALQSCVKN